MFDNPKKNPLKKAFLFWGVHKLEVGSKKSIEHHVVFSAPLAVFKNPKPSPPMVVLITALGLQGEKPLVDGIM